MATVTAESAAMNSLKHLRPQSLARFEGEDTLVELEYGQLREHRGFVAGVIRPLKGMVVFRMTRAKPATGRAVNKQGARAKQAPAAKRMGMGGAIRADYPTARSGYVLGVDAKPGALPGALEKRLRDLAMHMESAVNLLDEELETLLDSVLGDITLSFQPAERGPQTASVQAAHDREAEQEQAAFNAMVDSGPISLAQWVSDVEKTAEGALARNAERVLERRAQIVRECETVSPAAIADSLGSTAGNYRPLLQRKRDSGELLAFKSGSEFVYPAFQFDDSGLARPTVRELLKRGAGIGWPAHGGWALMLWLYSAHPSFQGGRPVDRLAGEPDAVLNAFERQFGTRAKVVDAAGL
jgi:hypothetical protein